MGLDQEINKAIGAHGLWKARLGAMIATGLSEVPIDRIELDHACDFGRWLHGPTLDAAVRSSPVFLRCRDLHATFHRVAAETARLAIAGRKAEAEKSMAPGGAFFEASLALTQAMMGWKRSQAA